MSRDGNEYNKDVPRKGGANTIDILEDCLQQIYEARKANLRAKQAKNAKQLQRRQLRLSRLNRPKTPLQGDQEAFFDEGLGDEDDQDDMGGMMELMGSTQSYDRDAPDSDAAFGTQFKNDVSERTASSKGKSITSCARQCAILNLFLHVFKYFL